MRRSRRRMLFVSTFVAALFCVATGVASADDWTWNFNMEYGKRVVSESDWAPFKDYEEVGVEASWGKADEPLLFATDFYVSHDEATHRKRHVESKSQELAIGLRKLWTLKKRWLPYFGAGISFISSDMELVSRGDKVSQKDRTAGLWIGGGLNYRIGSQFNVGMAGRLVPARSFSIFGEPRNATSLHLGLVVGWGSPLTPP